MAHRYTFSQDLRSPDFLLGEQRLSRRAILQRLAGLTLAGGSIASFVTACGSPTSISAASQIATPVSHTDTTFASQSQASTPSSHQKVLFTYHGHSASVNAVA